MSKILIVNVPFAGHVLPVLDIAEQLVKMGHDVSYICSERWKGKIEEHGVKCITYINYDIEQRNRYISKRCCMAAYTTALMVGKEYDIIVFEMYMFLGNLLAKQLNKPAVKIFTTFAYSDNVVRDFLKTQGILNRFAFYRKKMTDIQCVQLDMQEEDYIYENARSVSNLNIVCTNKRFQPYIEDFDDKFQFVGACIEERLKRAEKIDLYREEEFPIIYVSVGTVDDKGEKFYNKLFKIFGDKPFRVNVHLGPKTQISSLKNVPKNFGLYKSVNQLAMLKKASLFITHGGMNSINEAMYYAVPMIVIPTNADQFMNARRVCESGIGFKIDIDRISAKRFYLKACEIMEDSNVKNNLLLMQKETYEAGGSRRAAQLINDMLNSECCDERVEKE